MKATVPLSAVIATRNRSKSLSQTLDSLLKQNLLPTEFIVVDASGDDATKDLVSELQKRVTPSSLVRWVRAYVPGAALQRNQGVSCATQPFIWFFDDDVVFEPDCTKQLWEAIEPRRKLGGVNAMIVNQRYFAPGKLSRAMFILMHGRNEVSFAGKVIGPAINLLPEDRDDLPHVVAVDWLNLGCTIYRREALPDPPFDSAFTGYSLMEDVALSLKVAKRGWELANVRTARILHESQPGEHKANVSAIAAMQLVNRHYVMTRIMGRRRTADYLRLLLWEVFQLSVSAARTDTRRLFWQTFLGKLRGGRRILRDG